MARKLRPALYRVNLGGEGEIPGVLNQQGRWVLQRHWRSSRRGVTLARLIREGHDFLIADNTSLPLPDACVDVVITNYIPPVDTTTHLGPSVQTREIRRILKSGGIWLHNDNLEYQKP